MGRTNYKAGVFEMPNDTGPFTVNTRFRPRGVMFWGINTDQVDTVVSSSPRGMFLGQMGELYSDPDTLVSYAVAMMGTGSDNTKAVVDLCVLMSDGSCGVSYSAAPLSLDATGFTIDVDVPATGTRYVHWWAWGGLIQSGSYFGRGPGSPPVNTDLTVGYLFRSGQATLYHPASSDNACRFPGMFYGTTHWPADVPTTFSRSGLSCTSNVGIGDQGFVENWCFSDLAGDPTAGAVVEVLDATGPFVNSGFRYMRQLDTDKITLDGGGSDFYEMHSWWDGEGWTEMNPPGEAVDDVVSYTNFNPNFNRVALAAISHVAGGNTSGLSGGDGRFGYGVLTREHQSCCVISGDAGRMYQSLDKCAAKVDGTGLHSVTGELKPNRVDLTTVDSTTDPSDLVAHMFGPPVGGWVPQVYRRRVS